MAVRFGFFIVVSWASLCAAAGAAELGVPIDLSGLADIESPVVAEDDSLPLEEVAFASEPAARRFYVSGIIGDSEQTFSFVGLDGKRSGSVFTAGGAAGVSFARPTGALRLEFEGRGRGDYSYSWPGGAFTERWTDNWSTLINAWRDVAVTNRLGFYAGGGVGAGGFRHTGEFIDTDSSVYVGSNSVTTFAWQGGGGVMYQVGPRVTLDLGYRFYCLQPSSLLAWGPESALILPPGLLSSSEFLLSVRVYEPFRRWR